jgi:hypothetical protein
MRHILRLWLLLLAGALPGAASIVIDLFPSELAGSAGQTLTFQGTLTNNGTDTVFLNGAEDNLAVADLTGDESIFITSAPASLAASQSTGVIPLFQVSIASPLTGGSGPYKGTFDILGGVDAGAQDLVGSVDFQVDIAPEPAAWSLAGLGIALIGLAARRRHREQGVPAER